MLSESKLPIWIGPCCFEPIYCFWQRVAYRDSFRRCTFGWRNLFRRVSISWDPSWSNVLHEPALFTFTNREVSLSSLVRKHPAAIWTLFSVVEIFLHRSSVSMTLCSFEFVERVNIWAYRAPHYFRLLLPSWNIVFLYFSLLYQPCLPLDLWPRWYNSWLPYGDSAC